MFNFFMKKNIWIPFPLSTWSNLIDFFKKKYIFDAGVVTTVLKKVM